MSCEYCKQIKESLQKELRVLYQENVYADVYLGKALNKPALLVVRKGCPKYAECGLKDDDITSAFFINYCPNCGEKLER